MFDCVFFVVVVVVVVVNVVVFTDVDREKRNIRSLS
jgi:hypothetical protein